MLISGVNAKKKKKKLGIGIRIKHVKELSKKNVKKHKGVRKFY